MNVRGPRATSLAQKVGYRSPLAIPLQLYLVTPKEMELEVCDSDILVCGFVPFLDADDTMVRFGDVIADAKAVAGCRRIR
jgi:hypothetical protein